MKFGLNQARRVTIFSMQMNLSLNRINRVLNDTIGLIKSKNTDDMFKKLGI